MKIKALRALRGPNYFHRLPVIFMKLDIEELEDRPTDMVENFKENMEKMIPSLYYHTCTPGIEGGFFLRLQRGTWAGHVVEHIAIELQNLIGHKVSYGKTITLKERGNYNVVFRYEDEAVALKAAKFAVEIAEIAFEGQTVDISKYIEVLEEIAEESKLGPSTQSIVDEAKKRGIPYIRLNKNSYVQLGYGKFQRRIESTLTDNSSALGVEIAADKERTKDLLEEAGIPVPEGKAVKKYEEAKDFAEKIGYTLVVKPLDGNHGRGVTTNIQYEDKLKDSFENAKNISKYVVVEKYLQGFDFRLLVINGKLEAAALREPPYVIGDGKHSIKELIEIINKDPNRGEGHSKILTKITIDKDTKNVLDLLNYNTDDVLEEGKKVYLKSTANLSSGGTAVDVTDNVHPVNKLIAERIAKIVGLDIIGIDLLTDNIEKPLESGKSGVVEVNAGPGFRMHLAPSQGQARNVAKAVVDMLFPDSAQYDIPICAITGTNGKTTTTRLISHILNISGKVVGMTSTDAVVVDNFPILKGDYSGPAGAQAVLKDNSVECAVLEVARGGILRRGLGFNKCDVGVLLNVSSDHLGLGGIDTVEELARVKSTVTEAVKKDGYAIFNADDKLAVSRVDKTDGHVVFFSKDKNNPLLQENLKKDNFNVSIDKQKIIIQKASGNFEIANIINIPITFEGRAVFNIENVLAAVAASYALGVTQEQINTGLVSFNTSIGQSPGRMNIIDIGDFKVVVDYGHNVGAVEATGDFLRNLMPGRCLRMTSGVGDRRYEDILKFGKTIAKYFDYVVITDPSSRTRKLGETPEIVKKGLIEGGLKEENIDIVLKEKEAVNHILKLAKAGDLVVLQVENIKGVIEDVLSFRKKYLKEKGLNLD